MRLNILQYTEQPSPLQKKKNYLTSNVNSTEIRIPKLALSARWILEHVMFLKDTYRSLFSVTPRKWEFLGNWQVPSSVEKNTYTFSWELFKGEVANFDWNIWQRNNWAISFCFLWITIDPYSSELTVVKIREPNPTGMIPLWTFPRETPLEALGSRDR